jgi:3-hydroxyacyl-[acyl-carrier-protein] dehydratase
MLDDLYTVLESKFSGANTLEIIVDINKEHPIFNGHFPNFPVTPGVTLLQIIKNSLEHHLQMALALHSASNIKFLTLVNPYKQSKLVFKMDFVVENELIKIKNSTSFEDATPVMKCNVTFEQK